VFWVFLGVLWAVVVDGGQSWRRGVTGGCL
jgi:hypothetical protein